MSDLVGQKLFNAAYDGRASEVSSPFRDHPDIDVNWAVSEDQWTPLHAASLKGYVEVAKLLLAHPNINVNLKDSIGQTPLLFCCQWGHVSLVRLLLWGTVALLLLNIMLSSAELTIGSKY